MSDMFMLAGGQEVKIWDIVGGGRQLHVLSSHQKTVTTLCMAPSSNSRAALDQDAPRLLTASLDGHVKVFELSQFKVCNDLLDLFSCMLVVHNGHYGMLVALTHSKIWKYS